LKNLNLCFVVFKIDRIDNVGREKVELSVAVRSSATAEDTEEGSFAGQHGLLCFLCLIWETQTS
jgi:hypothetical protein